MIRYRQYTTKTHSFVFRAYFLTYQGKRAKSTLLFNRG